MEEAQARMREEAQRELAALAAGQTEGVQALRAAADDALRRAWTAVWLSLAAVLMALAVGVLALL
jgi:hypothetical protein